MGDHKKPNAIKQLQGTLRKDRVVTNYLQLPAMDKIPQPPADLKLNKEAIKIWNFHIVELVKYNIISQQDLILFSIFCIELARYFKLNKIIDAKGETMDTPSGFKKERPELKIMKDSFRTAYDIAVKFGLTPVSRDQIQVRELPKEKDILTEIEEME